MLGEGAHRHQHMKYQSQGSVFTFNTLRPRQNGRLFADDTFERIFLTENIRILSKISLKFVPKGLINNIPALVLIMAWRRLGDKPLSEPMMVGLPTHICVTRPQWVKVKMFSDARFQDIATTPSVLCCSKATIELKLITIRRHLWQNHYSC